MRYVTWKKRKPQMVDAYKRMSSTRSYDPAQPIFDVFTAGEVKAIWW